MLNPFYKHHGSGCVRDEDPGVSTLHRFLLLSTALFLPDMEEPALTSAPPLSGRDTLLAYSTKCYVLNWTAARVLRLIYLKQC